MTKLLSDADVSQMLRMSRSWVRKERFNRKHGFPHTLNIEPVFIGSVPRYPEEEVFTWIENIKSGRGDEQ